MKARSPNLRHCCADHSHLIDSEAIASDNVALRTSGLDVPLYVRERIVDPVQPPVVSGRAAEHARLFDQCENFFTRQITGINFLIGGSKKRSAASLCLPPSAGNNAPRRLLLRRQIRPALWSAVAAGLPRTVAFPALIREAERSARILQKHVWRRGQFTFAAIANAMGWLRSDAIFPFHERNIA